MLNTTDCMRDGGSGNELHLRRNAAVGRTHARRYTLEPALAVSSAQRKTE